jgi:hypothetical protein
MAPINLQMFCASEENKYRLNSPFSRAGYTWATDGKILVRVPLREDVPEVGEAPHAEGAWTHADGAFVPVIAFDIPKADLMQCDMCDGRGTEHDCPNCECKCDECDGTGHVEEAVFVSIGKSAMQRKYAATIMALPSLEVEIPMPDAQRMHFRFDGGEGILMLMRPARSYDLVADLLTGIL